MIKQNVMLHDFRAVQIYIQHHKNPCECYSVPQKSPTQMLLKNAALCCSVNKNQKYAPQYFNSHVGNNVFILYKSTV